MIITGGQFFNRPPVGALLRLVLPWDAYDSMALKSLVAQPGSYLLVLEHCHAGMWFGAISSHDGGIHYFMTPLRRGRTVWEEVKEVARE